MGKDGADRQVKTKKALRVRAAGSDARVGSLVSDIERAYKLPKGSVQIVLPYGRKARSDSSVATLRKKWQEAEVSKTRGRNTRRNAFLLPAGTVLTFYNGCDVPLFRSESRDFDLADRLMLDWPHDSRTIRLGALVTNRRWLEWGEDKISRIEALIRYDLEFDGYRVQMKRLNVPGTECMYEFRWQLHIRTER